jgi:ornithine carbamoyltransferase
MPRLNDPPSHLLTGEELSTAQLASLLERAGELKRGRAEGVGAQALRGRTVALYFERPSTRTRVSFQVGVAELGGHPLPLRADELQLGRGESIGDTARVLSRYLHAIVIRSGSDDTVAELAAGAEVPVVNALTPRHHPCQALADLLTLRERFGVLAGISVAYVGDGNNVARSLAILGRTAGVEVRVATPEGYELEPGLAALDTHDPRVAAAGADALYTDVWVSMGDEDDAARRRAELGPYRLDAGLLGLASERAIAMHCLPAHPGEEITAEVLYGERSAVWDQAENRLHAQKALLERLVG